MGASAEMVSKYFRNDRGEPFALTEGQEGIFDLIWRREHPRNQVICFTQYGKSSTVSMALISRVATHPEQWVVVAPTEPKAQIIMRYATRHALENEYTRAKLMLDPGETLDRLGRERSRRRLTFRMADGGRPGELFILSAGGHRTSDIERALAGFGAPNVVLDESSLLDDPQYAMVKRMVGGHVDNFILEIGNPFRRNHFHKTWSDPAYHKVLVDWRQGIAEGRITKEFVEEMRKTAGPLFGVLYDCQFPDTAMTDERGWTGIISALDLERACRDVVSFGEPRMGLDIGDGMDTNCWALRYDNYARILYEDKERDKMVVVARTLALAKEYGVNPKNIFVDRTGPGDGVYSRLSEIFRGQKISGAPRPVSLGEGPDPLPRDAPDIYRNRRAQDYWALGEWVRSGGSLSPDDDWAELLDVRYRKGASGRVEIEPKELMRARGVRSPNRADALMLTFDAPLAKAIGIFRPSRPAIRVPKGASDRTDERAIPVPTFFHT